MLRSLIIDGQNNHDWRATTPALAHALRVHGGGEAAVATSPLTGSDAEAWAGFQPAFHEHDAVVLNYTEIGGGDAWPDELIQRLVDYVADGGGLVVFHATASAFPHHDAYNRLIGLGWRQPDFGHRVIVNEDGSSRRIPPGEGPGAGHGPRHEFTVRLTDPQHPVTAGLPPQWRHAADELWHGQRGPAEAMQVLADAASDVTGVREPLMWCIPYGKGRVFVTLLGHDRTAMSCRGFQTTLVRGTFYAATGRVDLPTPDDLPSETQTALDPAVAALPTA